MAPGSLLERSSLRLRKLEHTARLGSLSCHVFVTTVVRRGTTMGEEKEGGRERSRGGKGSKGVEGERETEGRQRRGRVIGEQDRKREREGQHERGQIKLREESMCKGAGVCLCGVCVLFISFSCSLCEGACL